MGYSFPVQRRGIPQVFVIDGDFSPVSREEKDVRDQDSGRGKR